MELDQDFNEFVALLATHDVRYMIVGGYALAAHGLPRATGDLTSPDRVIQLGYPPYRIDLLTQISGDEFETAWARHIEVILDGVKVPFIGREDLIVNKRATGRPQDIADVLRLTANES